MSISFSMGMLNWVSWSQPVNPEPLESNSVELFCSRKVYKNAAIFIIPYYIIILYVYTALDYIQFLQSQSARHEEQLLKLRREVKALRIMKE